MKVDLLERGLPCQSQTHHHHTGNPKEEDVVPSFHHVAWVVSLVVWSLFIWPSQSCERPQSRGEPCVQHICLLPKLDVCVCTQLLSCHLHGFLFRPCDKVLVRHPRLLDVVDRNPVAPPKLARYTPRLLFLQPTTPYLGIALRLDANLFTLNNIHSPLCHLFSVDEPLVREEWLNHFTTSLGQGHSLHVWLLLQHQPCFLHVCPKLLPASKSIETLVLWAAKPCHFGIDASILGHDVEGVQAVPLGDLKVVEVVSWCDFKGSSPKLHVHIGISNHRYSPRLHRNDHFRADQVLVPVILWMHTNCCITQDCLGACCCNRNVLITIRCNHILKMVQFSLLLRILHFQVTHGGLELGVPIYHALALEDETHLMQADEGLYDSGAHVLVQGELFSRPIR
mmetsp:Transcript_27037/g.62479  ORF Transcript_27037/g.62479 Transcript_27037/m.62479 type:complete len:395 (-) Transcript_27037:851-2035(-)